MNAPLFFDDPDQIPREQHAELVRTPHTKPIKAIITSNKIIACPTHYHARRTIPCKGPGVCDLCAAGQKWRLHAYLSIINLDNLAHQIIEFPARQYDALAQWYRRLGTVRGLYIEACRPNARPNGPIQLTIKRPATEPPTLPDPLPIEWILCKIWGVPADEYKPQKSQNQNNQTPDTTSNHYQQTPTTTNRANRNDEPEPLTRTLQHIIQKAQLHATNNGQQ